LTRGDILLLVPSDGEDTLTDHDFKLPLFLVPVADIAAVKAKGDGTVRNREIAPVPWAPLKKAPLFLCLFRLIPLCHGESIGTNGRYTQRGFHRQKILPRLHR
jgi:hypothetical protein